MLNPAQQFVPHLATAGAANAPTELGPMVKKNVAGSIAFLTLCALCMTNINFVTAAMFNTEQAFSILYLIACLVVLFSFKFKMSGPIGGYGKFYIFAIAVFLIISTRFGMGIDAAFFLSPKSNFYRLIIAQGISVCCAMGARHMILRGKTQVMLRILFAFTVLAASTVLLTKFVPQILVFMGKSSQGRSGGFFEDPNRAGQSVGVAAAIGFACLVNEKSKFKIFVFAGLVLLVPCLFFTYSRSAIVFMALLVVMQFFISPIFKQKETIIGVLLIAAAMPVGVGVVLSRRGSVVDLAEAANLEKQQERMQGLFELMSGDFNEQNTGYRMTVAAVGWKYFRENPVIGAGYRKLIRMPEIGLGCHNTFLRVLGEAGIFGGVIFFAAVMFVGYCGWVSSMAEVRCMVVGFIAMYSCACMVSHTILTERLMNVMMGVCFGALSAALTVKRTEMRKQKQMRAAQTVQYVQQVAAAR